MPYAFTEQGVAMLSSVLKSQTAIEMNIAIMRAFIQLRRVVLAHQDILDRVDALQKNHIVDQEKNEERFTTIFDALDRGRLLPSGIIPANTEFDSLRQVSRLVGELAWSPRFDLFDPRCEGNLQAAGAGAVMTKSVRPLVTRRAGSDLYLQRGIGTRIGANRAKVREWAADCEKLYEGDGKNLVWSNVHASGGDKMAEDAARISGSCR